MVELMVLWCIGILVLVVLLLWAISRPARGVPPCEQLEACDGMPTVSAPQSGAGNPNEGRARV